MSYNVNANHIMALILVNDRKWFMRNAISGFWKKCRFEIDLKFKSRKRAGVLETILIPDEKQSQKEMSR